MRRAGAGVVMISAVLVLALTAFAPSSSARPVTSTARTAAACARERVNAGANFGELTLRFGLIGHVSCRKAHRLARTYFHKMATGQCGRLNNFCVLHLRRGWDCSIFFATESQQAGGAKAGCAQQFTGAKVRFFWRSRA